MIFANRWTLAAGEVLIRESGPRLGLGRVGSVTREFPVVGGTLHYTSASGSGRATITVQDVGATETWVGHVNVG
ncbi:MAG: hypothetical protein ACYDEA_02080 [Candidatus Dormibacteria bacterium]